jgi:hypothetical protein
MLLSTGLAALLTAIGLGGGLYEHSVVDPAWPRNPALIQPKRGGIKRVLFWLPAHIAFELTLIVALIVAWSEVAVRTPLLVALASHASMRIWSGFDMIPKALAFEKADPGEIGETEARAWTQRSLMRFPLALTTAITVLVAFGRASATAG